jgi:hypothetical protein
LIDLRHELAQHFSDSYHDIAQHSGTIERLWDLTLRLTYRWSDVPSNNNDNLDVEGTVWK